MSNMSYCRFENTLNDLTECLHVLSNAEPIGSQREKNSAKAMIMQMVEFITNSGLLDDDELDVGNMDEMLDACVKADEDGDEG